MRFSNFGKRVVFAAFDGGEITSDAGVPLLRERARRIHLFERMAGCFTDHRDQERRTHALPALLAQWVCGWRSAMKISSTTTRMFRPGPEIASLTTNRRSRDPGSTGRQVNAEPAGTILGNRQPPLSPDGPQPQETLQPVRHPVSRRPPKTSLPGRMRLDARCPARPHHNRQISDG